MPLHKRFFFIIVFFLIFVTGALLRFWHLGDAPKGALVDEAHFGYLAYSLLHTGKDEHGAPWPIIFTGFGDDKLPAYAYSLMPVVAQFGLNTWSIRVPSAVAGSVLPLTVALVALGIFWRARWRWWVAVFAAGLTALSPWPFFLSRFGMESNLGLLFFTFGLGFLMVAIGLRDEEILQDDGQQSKSGGEQQRNNERQRNERHSNKKHNMLQYVLFALTGISWALTWFAYISYRPVTLILLIFIFMWWGWQWWSRRSEKKNGVHSKTNELMLRKASVVVLASAFLLTLLPLFHPSALSSYTRRFGQVGITADQGFKLKIDEQRTFCNAHLPLSFCSALWNKPLEMVGLVASRYIHTFSPQYLATQGEKDTPFLTVENTGQFFLLAYPLFLVGLCSWLCFADRLHIHPLVRRLVLIGLFASPVPAVLAGEAQKVRLSPLYPFVCIMIASGAVALTQLVWRWKDAGNEKSIRAASIHAVVKMKKRMKLVIVMCWMGWWSMYLFSSIRSAIDFIFIHSAKNDFLYQSYLPETFAVLNRFDSNTQITFRPFFSDPILFYAYYNMVDPAEYQAHAVLGEKEASGFQHTVGYKNISVKDVSLETVGCVAKKSGQKAVFVTNEERSDVQPLEVIRSANQSLRYVFIYDASSVVENKDCP